MREHRRFRSTDHEASAESRMVPRKAGRWCAEPWRNYRRKTVNCSGCLLREIRTVPKSAGPSMSPLNTFECLFIGPKLDFGSTGRNNMEKTIRAGSSTYEPLTQRRNQSLRRDTCWANFYPKSVKHSNSTISNARNARPMSAPEPNSRQARANSSARRPHESRDSFARQRAGVGVPGLRFRPASQPRPPSPS